MVMLENAATMQEAPGGTPKASPVRIHEGMTHDFLCNQLHAIARLSSRRYRPDADPRIGVTKLREGPGQDIVPTTLTCVLRAKIAPKQQQTTTRYVLQDPTLELTEVDEKRGTCLVVAEVFPSVTRMFLAEDAAVLIFFEAGLVLVADVSPPRRAKGISSLMDCVT